LKFCQPHWDELKDAVKARGMWPLVAENGQAAINRMVDEIENRATDDTYDPLMSAHWMIASRALECGGLYLMTGEYCPLCEVENHTEAGEAAKWIAGCTDSIRTFCQERGILPN